ncbi:hypothetical protein AKJ62_00235 [candidate division MSBL1 archaeon SCGC-AAA259D14]|uniref:Nickel import system ATP-binding protein NikD n=1 Tax=candidate division MSBL1 archaeon SCGC-AAA259D14 TaxID=1698261 RepID=A0A133U8X2_9EURY|nr:hypothetical protein AKJ62_00235 [candidate division MSBL1 archaeon SCGC-AAA259D14]
MENVLEIKDLKVRFYTYAGVVKALEGINLNVRKGETFGIVGETGCGKSVTALSTLLLTPSPGQIEEGEILLERNGHYQDLSKLDEAELRDMRGNEISMVFQEPGEALNPVYSVGEQIAEAFLAHRQKEMAEKILGELEDELKNEKGFLKRNILKAKKKIYKKIRENPDSYTVRLLSKIPIVKRYRNSLLEESERRAVKILDDVGIPEPEEITDKNPHELSGGMKQRVVISMALACKPKLLIADEPTSNLDVSIQARILNLLNDLKEEYGLSILYITHDLGVVAQTCDRAGVMYAGRIIEVAEIEELFENPKHPYTKTLLMAVPSPEKENLESVGGSVPDLVSPPPGCRFHPRCNKATEICSKKAPPMEEVKEEHTIACHNWRNEDEDNS